MHPSGARKMQQLGPKMLPRSPSEPSPPTTGGEREPSLHTTGGERAGSSEQELASLILLVFIDQDGFEAKPLKTKPSNHRGAGEDATDGSEETP